MGGRRLLAALPMAQLAGIVEGVLKVLFVSLKLYLVASAGTLLCGYATRVTRACLSRGPWLAEYKKTLLIYGFVKREMSF